MSAPTTTVRDTHDTVRDLERWREALHTRSANDTIRALMRLRARETIRSTRGIDRGRLTPFHEEDRGEERR